MSGQVTRRWTAVACAMLVMAAFAVPAEAITLAFSQTAGFRSTGATVQGLTGGPAIAGQGGLDFFNAVTGPPGPPIGDGSAPPNIWQVVGWGCTPSADGNIPAASCANGGTIGVAAPSPTNPFGSADRSALEALGQFGFLTDAAWTDITLVRHQNNVISGNSLDTVSIDSILRLGPDPFPIADPDTVTTSFRETVNFAATGDCTVQARPTAPINPLGSPCDDFFVLAALDLSSVTIPAGIFFPFPVTIQFRLDPRDGALVCTGVPANDPAACGGYTGSEIIVYTAENDINSLAVQARLIAVVPSPASLMLLGVSLVGGAAVVALRRRLRA